MLGYVARGREQGNDRTGCAYDGFKKHEVKMPPRDDEAAAVAPRNAALVGYSLFMRAVDGQMLSLDSLVLMFHARF